MRNAQPQSLRPWRQRLIQQVEEALARPVTAPRSSDRFYPSFYSKTHHGLQVELCTKPGPPAPQAAGADQPLEVVHREEPARLLPHALQLTHDRAGLPTCCSKLHATHHQQALSEGDATAIHDREPASCRIEAFRGSYSIGVRP